MTAPSRVVLGVSGGIAAYKAVELLRQLTEAGQDVTVVPTEAALQFVGRVTWEALSHHPVQTDVWSGAADVAHVSLGRTAQLLVVAPATADLIARVAHGQADDLLTTTLLTARCPVLMAPAMHTEMWLHSATVDNVATLRRRGVTVLEPAIGRLTGSDSGAGRLPEPSEIADLAMLLLHTGTAQPADLVGRKVLVTTGGTREPLDPVRFLGNRSSGRQGLAIASVAAARGAQVTIVAANVPASGRAGATVIEVGTAAQLRQATLAAARDADVVVMAAAVADFRPRDVAEHKIKKAGLPAPIELSANPDVLAELVAERAAGRLGSPVLVGFAAETGDESNDVLSYGRTKLARKGCDLLVVNSVSAGQGFGRADNAAEVLGDDGTQLSIPLAPKIVVAAAVWDAVVSRLPR